MANVPKFNIPSMPRPQSSTLPSSIDAESEDEMVDKRRLTLRRNNRIYVTDPQQHVVESYHFSQLGKLIPTPSPLITRSKSNLIGNSESEVEPSSSLPERLFRKTSSSLIRSKKMTTTTLKGIIYGPPAAGKGTQCEVITSQFGVIHLSTGDILRSAIAKNTPLGKIPIHHPPYFIETQLSFPLTPPNFSSIFFIVTTGLQAKPYMDQGALVPDDLVIKLILNRLKQEDCESRGWLLDGFPRTKTQADALFDAGIIPDVFLVLDVPEEVLVERVTGRRTDPVTGKIYHMKFKPPPNDPEILDRLIIRSDDTVEKIKTRYQEFSSHIEAVEGLYEKIMVRINGELAPTDVSKMIVEQLEDIVLGKIEQEATMAAATMEGTSSTTTTSSSSVTEEDDGRENSIVTGDVDMSGEPSMMSSPPSESLISSTVSTETSVLQ